MRELYRLLWTLIHRPKKAAKPKRKTTAHKKAAPHKPARKTVHKTTHKTPAPRSGAAHHPKKAHPPRPATHAALA